MDPLQDFDRAYANGAFIPGSHLLPARWEMEAAGFRASLGGRFQGGVPYGSGGRQQFDLFSPKGEAKGLMVFVHGGYWLKSGRESWSHLAAGALERGWACAMPSYTLAPEARISEMTVEVASAVRAAARLVTGPVVVTGHSAGGHLAARMGCGDQPLEAVVRVVPISAIADLSPIARTAMNGALKLSEAEIASESPARLVRRAGCSAHVWVGAQERPSFLWQARLLSEDWGCDWTAAPGRRVCGSNQTQIALCQGPAQGLQARRSAAGVHPLDIAAHLFSLVAGVAQALHRGAQFGVGLGYLVQKLGLALFKVQNRLVTRLFGLVQRLGHAVHLDHIATRDAGKAVQKPVGKPAERKGHEQDDRYGKGEFGAVHGLCMFDA